MQLTLVRHLEREVVAPLSVFSHFVATVNRLVRANTPAVRAALLAAGLPDARDALLLRLLQSGGTGPNTTASAASAATGTAAVGAAATATGGAGASGSWQAEGDGGSGVGAEDGPAAFLRAFPFEAVADQPRFRDSGGLLFLLRYLARPSGVVDSAPSASATTNTSTATAAAAVAAPDRSVHALVVDILANVFLPIEENRRAVARMIEDPVVRGPPWRRPTQHWSRSLTQSGCMRSLDPGAAGGSGRGRRRPGRSCLCGVVRVH
jgi:hypothetical protein